MNIGKLTPTEETGFQALVAIAKEQEKPQADHIKEQRVKTKAPKLAKRRKISVDEAEKIIRSRSKGNLMPNDEIIFQSMGRTTVTDILNDLEKYNLQPCADPLEPEEGTGRAMLFANADTGHPVINSMLHGGIVYSLKNGAGVDFKPDSKMWHFAEATAILDELAEVDDRECTREVIANIFENNDFTVLELNDIRNQAKKQHGFNKGSLDAITHQKTSTPGDDDRTHSNLADDFIQSNLNGAISCESFVWQFDEETGLWESSTLDKLAGKIGKSYSGKNCKKGSDYTAISKLVYHQILHDDFFKNAPFGVPAKSYFIRLDENDVLMQESYRPEHRQRFKLAADPEPGEKPLFQKWLDDSFQGGDTEQVATLQEICGAIITGSMSRLQKAIFLYGSGANGKSVLLVMLAGMLPPELQCAVPPALFSDQYYRAQLAGKVLNIVGEIEKSKPLKAEFKDIIACDSKVSARMPYKMPFEFTPTAAHIFAGNHLLATKDHTHGFYRRWALFDFQHKVPADERIPNMGEKIIANELPGVLQWCLVGAKRLAKNKFILTTSFSHETLMEKWKNRADSVFAFLSDDEFVKLVPDHADEPAARVRKLKVYEHYKEWAHVVNVRAVGRYEFYDRAKLKLSETRENNTRFYHGIFLLEGRF